MRRVDRSRRNIINWHKIYGFDCSFLPCFAMRFEPHSAFIQTDFNVGLSSFGRLDAARFCSIRRTSRMRYGFVVRTGIYCQQAIIHIQWKSHPSHAKLISVAVAICRCLVVIAIDPNHRRLTRMCIIYEHLNIELSRELTAESIHIKYCCRRFNLMHAQSSNGI